MDLNVCSRRVHDGYATIRSRGRNRPRAVYRSDSEELLKDAGGPYALPRVSNNPLSNEQIHQVPRWTDTGKNKLSENYGTLRRGEKNSEVCLDEMKGEKIILNTFSSSKNQLDREHGNKDEREIHERLYDTVPLENPQDYSSKPIRSDIGKNSLNFIQNEKIVALNNLYDTVPAEKITKKVTRRKSEIIRSRVEKTHQDESPKINGASRQPIYAVPNIPRQCNDEKFDCRLSNDGNYVPSGDLYRTTARYIEDINRNIAEIDKSYEELRCSSNSSSINSAYGIINKVPRSNDSSIEQIDDNLYSGFHRKRDILAPMPPISPNFGENTEVPSTPIFTRNDFENVNDQASRFDFKIPRNSDPCRESVRTRPNSYGKLPPKLLPRSSSMDNNSLRHSTGSTTTSSSTKSTESLYAISETLLEMPKSNDADDNEVKSPKKLKFPKTMIENDEREFSKDDLRHAIDLRLRRNRSLTREDDATRINRDKCKINCRNSGRVNRSSEDSMTLSEKDQRSCYIAPSALSVTNKPAACTRSRSRCVDLLDGDDSRINDSRVNNKTRNFEKNGVTVAPMSCQEQARLINYNSTGTIRRNRCSSRIEDNDDYYNDDNDEETSLIGNKKRQPKIKNSQNDFRKKKNTISTTKMGADSENGEQVHIEWKHFEERRYGTLPSRRTKNSRPLHKSSEDVLESERKCQDDSVIMQRSCISTMDVRDETMNLRDGTTSVGSRKNVALLPLYLVDATELILQGQLHRKVKKNSTMNKETSEIDEIASSKSSNSIFNDDSEKSLFDSKIDQSMRNRFSSTMTKSRTRHNSLESDDVETGKNHQSVGLSPGSFATLPRRGNCGKEQRANADPPRRLSGNVPVLEPLYEHAVSDPVKPRSSDNNVIPWWELATRKYRHRSCPALQDHVVQAFEQSLSNMNQRLKQLTATAEKKDSELQELRDTIERLRKQSAEAGLNGATSNGRRHTLGDSDSGTTGCAGYSNNQAPTMARQLSADSVTSLNSLSSACSASSHRKKKGWLGSFSKKFSRARKNRHGSVSDAEDCKDGNTMGDLSAPNSPRLPTAAKHENSHNHNHNSKANGQKSPEHENPMTGSKSSSALYKKEDEDVDDLKEQLRQKDLVLTDITLEALKSSGELHSLKEKIAEMKNEMKNLRENNERLQRLVTSKSLTSSQSSMPTDPERRYSMTEVAYSVTAMSNGDHHPNNGDQMEDINVTEHAVVSTYTTTQSETVIEQDTDGKRISVAVYLGSEKSFNVNLVSCNNEEGVGEPPHCIIASVCISNKTTWDSLDNTVRRCFKDYVSRVDPVTNLGLGVDHVAAYHLGESSRFTNDAQHPELLPCGYLIGHVKTIYLVLTGYSWLAIDTLIPKSIVQRLLSLLTEHRRLILCGPSGTGKNYLAGKLAHALVDADSDADAKDAAAVATFNVDHKSSKELRQYLAHIAERCDSNAADELPKVIILENLQHAASLGELFSGLLGTRHSTCPAIIGTMSQATCSTTNLQLHHNFRWVLCRKDMEPVKGFLGRYLRRKILEQQLRDTTSTRNPEMAAVVEWLPRVWLHLNKFLETHSSSDVTIGPSLFLSCPMEVAGSQVWFTDLWNYSIRPYLVEAVKEGTGEVAWEDPAQFITTTYPWIATHAVHGGRDALLRLRPEDVGYDVVSSGHNSGVGASSVKSLGSTHSDTDGDPLLNMLMRLQEAANYSSPHSNDSDSVTSMDSSHTRHSEDLSTSTSSSRGVESAL